LLAEYFDSAEFQGQPKLRRVEPGPDLQSGMLDAAVAAAFPSGVFSVRWSGSLRAPVTGDYTFSPKGRPGIRIFLDNRDLTAGPAPAPNRGAPTLAHAQLAAGRSYPLRVEYRAGPGAAAQVLWAPPASPLLAEAMEAVSNADVTLAFVGLNPSLEGEEMPVSVPGFQGGDRTNLELPEPQQKLIEAAVAAGKPVIVVLASGSAVAVNYAAQHANAVLETWYNGEETGTAIAETLAGVSNPSGRLPVTFYKSVDQLPPFDDYAMKGRTYRYFNGEPLYGFGFGLSYATFQYSGLKARRDANGAQVTLRVKNSSPVDGEEVVQLYLSEDGAKGEAIRSLRGFQRVHLRHGESREVQFRLRQEDISSKKLRISVGGGQPVGGIPHVEGPI
jgi:beta-glucosidase